MAIEIETPNGIVEFPDGTPTDVIERALAAESNGPQKASMLDAGLQGLTLGFSDELAGIGNVLGSLGSSGSVVDRYRHGRDRKRQELEALQESNPLLSVGLEVAGGLLNPLGTGKKIGDMVMAGAKVGGLMGAGKADELSDVPGDMVQGAAVGAALPAVLAGGAETGQALLKGGRPDKVKQKHIDTLKSIGVTLTTGQKGRDATHSLETTIARGIGGGPLANAFEGQRQKVQAFYMRNAGVPKKYHKEGVVTQDMLDETRQRFTSRYDEIIGGDDIRLGDRFLNDLAAAESKHRTMADVAQKKAVGEIIDDVLGRVTDGKISSADYQALRAAASEKQYASSGAIRGVYKDIKNALDKAFGAGLGADKLAAKRKLDQEYAGFKVLDDMFKRNSGATVAQGYLPLASMWRASKNKPVGKRWKEVAEASSALMGDTLGNSGTATRAEFLDLAKTPIHGLASAAKMSGVSSALAKDQVPGIFSTPVRRASLLPAIGAPSVGELTSSEPRILIGGE